MSDEAEARKTQTRAIFDRLAPEYDAAGPGCFGYFGRRLVEEIGIGPGQRVLDVATGRGAVVGIDLAEGMVRATNEEAERRALAAPVRVMDAEQLEFPDAAFSRVLCGFGLMFFPHLDRAFDEFRRVLEPGGRIGVSTWQVSQAEDMRAVLDEEGLGGTGEPSWITNPDELADLLKRAGFSDVRVRVDSNAFRYADLEEYWQTARGTNQRRRLDTLNTAQTARIRIALAQRLRPYQQKNGIYLQATALLATAGR